MPARRLALLFALALIPDALLAQSSRSATTDSAAGCLGRLDGLARKIEQNYAGMRFEIVGDRRRAYERALAALRDRASVVDGEPDDERCYGVLSALTEWFDDPHLFVFQNPVIDSAESARRAREVRVLAVDEASVRADIGKRGVSVDPVEGIWYDVGLRLAVVPEPGAPAGRFVAVILQSDTATWRPGAVRARFARRDDGSYDVDLWGRNYARRSLHGVIYRRTLLRFSPGTWAKAYPVAPADSGMLDPNDPRRPTLRLRERDVIVSMPSHDPTYRPVLDSLVAANVDALRRADRLIVDVRGNEGGSSYTSRAIEPWIASARRRSSRYDEGEGAMLSSPDQIAYAKRAFGPDTSAFVRSLVARLEARPGEMVPLRDPADREPEPTRDSVATGPTRVAVLVDRGTVSASEVLVLQALRSERATVIGENTAGALDYQSTSIVRIAPGERRWYLGYPTIARDTIPPTVPMRAVGIAPDVHVEWRTVQDPYALVARLLPVRR